MSVPLLQEENKERLESNVSSTESPETDGNKEPLTGTGMAGLAGEPDKMKVQPSYYSHDDGTYSVKFHKRPFGMHIGKTHPDKANLYVTRNDPDSEAERGGVRPDSVIIKIQGENVENLGASVVNKIFGGRYGTTLPLTITFRPGSAVEVGLDKKIMKIPSKLSNRPKNEEGPATEMPTIVSVPTMEDDDTVNNGDAANVVPAETEDEADELSVDDEPQSPDQEAAEQEEVVPPAPEPPTDPTNAEDEEYEYYYEEEEEVEMDNQAAVAVEEAFAEVDEEEEEQGQNLEELE